MIKNSHGDILKTDAEALVNTVNCVGIMGRGVALQFRKAYPANFAAYKAACDRGEVMPGKMFLYSLNTLVNPKYIINFPTKQHWKGESSLDYIESGLKSLVAEIPRLGITSIAIPPLGCGLGGLNWGVVRPRIEQAFTALPGVQVFLYAPGGAPAPEEMAHSTAPPKMTKGRAALIELMHQYLSALMDPFTSLLELHKLMYFMQEAGEPLRLRYVKGHYGPYAENLKNVLTAIDSFYVLGYGDASDTPEKSIELVPEAIPMARSYLEEDQHRETRERLQRVADLIEGFETPYGMELLATVHWLSRHENAADPSSIVQKTYEWNPRKRQFSEEQIHLAWRVLNDKGWLRTNADASD